MWNQVWKWLIENYPLVFFCIILVVVVWLIAKFYYQRFKTAEKRIAELPCAARGEQYNQIKEDLLQIKMFLMAKNPKTATIFSVKNSPRALNEEGLKLLEEIHGNEFLAANSALFINAIQAKNPQTALDVEVYAHDVLIESLNLGIFNELKHWVYNSPTRSININGNIEDYSVTLGDICFILSLPLRDKYLAQHPEIAQ